jgi:hypothetical protein
MKKPLLSKNEKGLLRWVVATPLLLN